MSQLTLFDCITQNKRPRTESTDDSSITSCKTTADLEVCSPTNNSNSLELVDSVDVDTAVSSPIQIDSDSNEDLSTPLSLSRTSSLVSEEHDACTPVTTTLGTQSGSKTCTAVSDIAQSPAFPPVKPKHVQFPTTTYSSRARSFNPAWYDTYDLLEYSVGLNACFCYPCRLFGSQGSSFTSKPESAFTIVGFKDWKYATGKNSILNGHNNCITHKQSVIAWKQFQLNTKQSTSISQQLDNTTVELIQKNRHYLKTILEVLLLCSKQEIAL